MSGNGLVWTFHLKPGIHYAPPLEDSEIRAEDFVRALERTARLPDEEDAFHYTIIEGFDRFSAGEADSISGHLQTLHVV